jgi:hypothetical protein
MVLIIKVLIKMVLIIKVLIIPIMDLIIIPIIVLITLVVVVLPTLIMVLISLVVVALPTLIMVLITLVVVVLPTLIMVLVTSIMVLIVTLVEVIIDVSPSNLNPCSNNNPVDDRLHLLLHHLFALMLMDTSMIPIILKVIPNHNLPIITVLQCRRRPDSTITNDNLHSSMILIIILLDPIATQVIPILIIPMMIEMEDI